MGVIEDADEEEEEQVFLFPARITGKKSYFGLFHLNVPHFSSDLVH